MLSGIFGAGAVTAMACGGGPAEAPQSPANASAAPAASGAPATGDSSAASASAAASAAPSPLASVLITDSGTVQKLFDAANAADPDGPLALGSLKEKQHLQTDVTLKPGRCYAVVGYSPKIKDLDLHLFLPPGILSGQDTTDDNKPVIGRAPDWMCPGATTAITYKVDIFADDGAGEIAVQLYSKGK